MAQIQVTLAVQAEGDGSIASTVMVDQPKYGPLGQLMDVMMMRKGMAGGMQGLLAGLKHYCEKAEVQSPNPQSLNLLVSLQKALTNDSCWSVPVRRYVIHPLAEVLPV
ncbi:hypothetical protein GC175_03570 [bacterium]|nr:hypothetical protein [bacterium]